MQTKKENQKPSYPWKGFLIFLGIFLLSVATQFPVLIDQAELLNRHLGDPFAYNPPQFAIIALAQPLLLGVVAVYGGHRYAKRVKLRSLINEKVENEELVDLGRKRYTLKESIPFIVVFSIAIALLHLGFDVIFQNWLPAAYQPNFVLPNVAQGISNIFYSGLVQEVLLRWGIMTTIIYVLSSKGQDLNKWVYLVGIIFTAILFAFAQSSAISFGDMTPIVWLRILLLNALDGILYGWLYYKFHFEASVLSHMLTNVLIIGGTALIVTIGG